jgi:hypothetical protein
MGYLLCGMPFVWDTLLPSSDFGRFKGSGFGYQPRRSLLAVRHRCPDCARGDAPKIPLDAGCQSPSAESPHLSRRHRSETDLIFTPSFSSIDR